MQLYARNPSLLSTKFPSFRPARLLQSGFLQTLSGFVFPGKMSDYRARHHVVGLSDGDRIVIHDDQPETWIAGDRIAILIHGLCGCHSSPYMRRTSDKLCQNGIRTIRVDMRGFGSSALISRSHSHAGSSGDIRDVVSFVHELSPLSRVSLVGFSLGANVVLKTLGEWGPGFPKWIDSAVAVSPPIDLVHSSANLRRSGNRFVDHYFMTQLRQSLFFRRRHVRGLVDPGLNPLPDRLIHFDDQFVAPVLGLSGAREYYETSSSGPLLKDIHVPTILLAAVDDPIVPFEMFGQFEMSPSVEMVSTDSGGHLGFFGRHPGDPDRYWLDWRLSHWISSLDRR